MKLSKQSNNIALKCNKWIWVYYRTRHSKILGTCPRHAPPMPLDFSPHTYSQSQTQRTSQRRSCTSGLLSTASVWRSNARILSLHTRRQWRSYAIRGGGVKANSAGSLPILDNRHTHPTTDRHTHRQRYSVCSNRPLLWSSYCSDSDCTMRWSSVTNSIFIYASYRRCWARTANLTEYGKYGAHILPSPTSG